MAFAFAFLSSTDRTEGALHCRHGRRSAPPFLTRVKERPVFAAMRKAQSFHVGKAKVMLTSLAIVTATGALSAAPGEFGQQIQFSPRLSL